MGGEGTLDLALYEGKNCEEWSFDFKCCNHRQTFSQLYKALDYKGQCQVKSLTYLVVVHKKGTPQFSPSREHRLCVSPGNVDHQYPMSIV